MMSKVLLSFILGLFLVSGTSYAFAVDEIELTSVDLICDGDTEIGYTDLIEFLVMCDLFGASPPIITLIGDAIIELTLGDPYVEQGATAIDVGDGDVSGSIVIAGDVVDIDTVGAYFITYNVADSLGNNATDRFPEVIRTVLVETEMALPTPSGGGGGNAPTGDPDPQFTVQEFTEQQLAFQQSLEDALSRIADTEASPFEALVQTFFEFTVVDKTHQDLQLQSFLDDERLGIRWSNSDDIVVVSVIPSPSPFLLTFEQLPAIKRGSGTGLGSTNFLTYNLEIPRNECTILITQDCVQKVRYEIPVTVNAVIDGIQVSDTGTITVDLTEELIDPILLILLATFSIPLIAGIVQRSKGRPDAIEAIRRSV